MQLTKQELQVMEKALEVLMNQQAKEKVNIKVFKLTASLLYKVRGELVNFS